MENARPVKSYGLSLARFLQSGNCRMRLFLWKRFRGRASGNSRKLRCGNSSPDGSGIRPQNNFLSAVAGVDANVFCGEVAGPVTRARFTGVQIHNNRNEIGEQRSEEHTSELQSL